MTVEVALEQAEWMVDQAGFSGVVSVQPLSGGWDNTNLRLDLDGGTSLVLKIWEAQKSLDDVQTVIQRHTWIEKHGVPTTVPVMLESGGRFAVRNGVAWTLLPYVSGGHLGSDTMSLKSLGAVMARLHEMPPAECFPHDYRMGWSLFERMFALADESGGWSDFLVVLREESSRLRGCIPDNLPQGVLHGDLFPDNVLGDGEVAAILDFEEAWIGPRAFDLVMAFVGFGWDGGQPVGKRWNALLSGYESVRSLTKLERVALPTLYRYATLSIAAWRYWKHVMSEPDEVFEGRYLEMVDRLGVEFDFMEEFD
jgi:homoserine kinase type II